MLIFEDVIPSRLIMKYAIVYCWLALFKKYSSIVILGLYSLVDGHNWINYIRTLFLLFEVLVTADRPHIITPWRGSIQNRRMIVAWWRWMPKIINLTNLLLIIDETVLIMYLIVPLVKVKNAFFNNIQCWLLVIIYIYTVVTICIFCFVYSLRTLKMKFFLVIFFLRKRFL